jgi:hypothetical protein
VVGKEAEAHALLLATCVAGTGRLDITNDKNIQMRQISTEIKVKMLHFSFLMVFLSTYSAREPVGPSS